MSVALVDNIAPAQSGGSVVTFSRSLTASALSNGALVVSVILQNGGGITSVTWNGVTVSPITGAAALAGSPGTANVALFGLLNPASGTNNLVVNWPTTGRAVVTMFTFSGVDQGSFATSFINGVGNTGTSTTPSTGAISSSVGDLVVGLHSAGDGVSTIIAVDNNTLYTTTTLGALSNGANWATGASPNVTLGATYGASTNWASVGFDLKQVLITPPTLQAQVCF